MLARRQSDASTTCRGDRVMSEKTLEQLSRIGPLILGALVALLGLAGAWGSSTYQLSSHGQVQKDILAEVRGIAIDIAGMKATATFTKDGLAKLEDRVHRLEARR